MCDKLRLIPKYLSKLLTVWGSSRCWGEGRLIPCKNIHIGYGLREQLNAFGDDYETSDGSCIRDYIHVVDLAKAHIIAIERLIDFKNTRGYEVFNNCTGNGFSVFEVINSFKKTTDMKLNNKVAPRRAGDIVQIWADTKIGNEVLGWKAKKILDEMTSSAWKWEKNYREGVGQ